MRAFLIVLVCFFSGCAVVAPYNLKEITPQNSSQSFVVTNRNTMSIAKELSDKEYILISIRNNKSADKNLRIPQSKNMIACLRVWFDDVTNEKNGINEEHARSIVLFYKEFKNVPVVVIQCDAGISRSSAVAAALMKFSTGDDSKIWNGNFVPNKLVYQKVLKACYE